MFNVKWIDLKNCEISTKKFNNYEDKLEFCAVILFPKILSGEIARI